MAINRGYIESLSLSQIRDELAYSLEGQFELSDALRNLPECPPAIVLHLLSHGATFPEDWNRGKTMQGAGHAVPFNTECEMGAGLWSIIRAAIAAARDADHKAKAQTQD